MRFSLRVGLLCVLCLTLWPFETAISYSSNQESQLRFLTALVTGPNKEPLTNLTQTDFQLLEDGQPLPIASFQRAATVHYGVALDQTGSMREALTPGLQIARALVKAHQPGDQAFLARLFNTEVLLPVAWTADHTLLLNGLNSLNEAKGSIPLLDALSACSAYAAQRPARAPNTQPQSVLFIVTDGIDREAMPFKLRDLKKSLQANAVQVFPIGILKKDEGASVFFGKSTQLQARELLNEIAEASGGRPLYVDEKMDPALVGQLAARYVHSQIVIGYQPSATTSKKARKMQLKLMTKPNLPQAQLTYWPPS